MARVPELAPPGDPLVAHASTGDPGAQRLLVSREGPRLWSLCRRLTDDPEDAYQEVWERVFRALPGFDQAGSPIRAWIATIAHRHLVDRWRRRQVRNEVPFDDDVPTVPPSGDVDEALRHLPEAHRRVVLLHHLHGLSLEEIAANEAVALGTIKSRLHRARAALALALGESP